MAKNNPMSHVKSTYKSSTSQKERK